MIAQLICLAVFCSAVGASVSATEPPSFERAELAELVSHAANSTGVAWIDFDGDGKLDLFASAYGGFPELQPMPPCR